MYDNLEELFLNTLKVLLKNYLAKKEFFTVVFWHSKSL